MNYLDLCLEVVSRSRQPFPLHLTLNISETVRDSLGYNGAPIGNGIWAIEWSPDRWRQVTLKGQTRDRNTLRAQYLENYVSYRLQIWYAALYGECQAGAEIIFPQSGRGLGHGTPTIFGILSNMSLLCGSTVGYPSDSLASCFLITTTAITKAGTKVQIFNPTCLLHYRCPCRNFAKSFDKRKLV